MFDKWHYDVPELFDDTISQQLLCTLGPDLKSFVLSRELKSADEANSFADLHVQMCRNAVVEGAAVHGGIPGMGLAKKLQGQTQAPAQSHSGNNPQPSNGLGGRKGACYTCGSLDHRQAFCPLGSHNVHNSWPSYNACCFCGA